VSQFQHLILSLEGNALFVVRKQNINLREVRSDSNSSGSGVDFGGTVGLIGLVAAGWAFFTFTPWILMCLGGVTGTWIGQKVTGQTLEDYN